MNIKQAKNEIKNTVQAYLQKDDAGAYRIPVIRQRPILLIGPPGIGKTQIMEQIARECRIGLVAYTITHHTRQSAVGLPFIMQEEFQGKTYSVTEYTMSEIIASVYRKIKDTGLQEGILFIDEINCVSETLAPTMLQFLQCKTFGNQQIPEGWIIVAAGNPPEYNKSVREFDMVTMDRVRKLELEANLEVWREYAVSQHVQNAITAYLQLRPQNFYRVESDVDGLQFVTARGWEDLSNLLDVYESFGIPVEEYMIHEFIQHDEVAKDVAAYFDLYRKYRDDYGIQEILQGNVKPEVYGRIEKAGFDERISVVNLLLSGLNQYFETVYREKYLTDQWYEFLKKYHKRMESVENPVELYQNMADEFEINLETGKKSGFYDKQEEQLLVKLLTMLRNNKPECNEVEECFLQAKKGFEKQRSILEYQEQETMKTLEYAFDFMESAFQKGQEMVVFVTELTMGKESAAFLAENECERYHQYNRELMVGTKKAELLAELEVGMIREQEHI